MSVEKECPRCNDRGWVSGKTLKECPMCLGEGVIVRG